MDVSAYKTKFKLLFETLFQDHFELSAYYSENLLNLLEGNQNKCAEKILQTPFFADLIIYALQHVEQASISVKLFIVHCTNIILRNEVHFNRFQQLRGFDLLVQQYSRSPRGSQPALHLAHLRQALVLTRHYSGVRWLAEAQVWRHVLTLDIPFRSAEVAAGTCEFISKLVWKLDEYEEEAALVDILQFLVLPITSIDNGEPDDARGEGDPLLPSLNALLAILGEIKNVIVPNKVVPLLSRHLQLEAHVAVALQAARAAAHVAALAELSLRLTFAASRDAAGDGSESETQVSNELSAAFSAIVQRLHGRRDLAILLDFLCRCNLFWHDVQEVVTPAAFERFGRRFEIQHQFTVMLLVPIMIKFERYKLALDSETDNTIQGYMLRVFDILPDTIVKAGYAMRQLVYDMGPLEASVLSARAVFRLRGRMSRGQANLVFQTMYYVLQDYVAADDAGDLLLDRDPIATPQDELLLALVMDAIKMVIDDHGIDWYESCEIVSLQSSLIDLIKRTILPSKLVVRAVELIDLCVRKFLSPELALLMEARRGSSLSEVAAVLSALLSHTERVVRVAATQLLLSCTQAAHVKYVPLRKLISENSLMVLAVQTALTDPEPLAQTTALRCLGSATKCECIWKEVLTAYQNLYEQLVLLVRYNPDGRVRKEAVSVLTEVYINNKVTQNFTTGVGKVMAKVAADDPHWEVQVAALRYWRQAIKNQFSYRGMIDNRFPSVTFSKEKRKIVTFNEKEIEAQLTAIMEHLSAIGCLSVLQTCLTSSQNADVLETAFNISSEVMEVLDFYSFKELPTERIHMSPRSSGSDRKGDIEAKYYQSQSPKPRSLIWVMQPDPNDLLSEIVRSLETSDLMEEDSIDSEKMHPNSFIEWFKSTDYPAVIQNKKAINSPPTDLDTLIDEILLIREGCSPNL